jgi:hypothetical protein
MYICKPALLLSVVLTLVGTLLAGLGNWSAGAYYGVVAVAVFAYFVVLSWLETRRPKHR